MPQHDTVTHLGFCISSEATCHSGSHALSSLNIGHLDKQATQRPQVLEQSPKRNRLTYFWVPVGIGKGLWKRSNPKPQGRHAETAAPKSESSAVLFVEIVGSTSSLEISWHHMQQPIISA